MIGASPPPLDARRSAVLILGEGGPYRCRCSHAWREHAPDGLMCWSDRRAWDRGKAEVCLCVGFVVLL